MNAAPGSGPVRLLVVGSSLPPDLCSALPGFSAAGALFQEGLLGGLLDAGLRIARVASVRAVSSFPRARRIWFGPGEAVTKDGLPVTLLPFLNAGPLKTLTLGAAVLLSILHWGWKERRQRGRRVVLQYNVNTPPAFAVLLAARIIGARAIAVVMDLQVPGSGLLRDTPARRAAFRLQTWSLPRFDGLAGVATIASDFAPRVPFLAMEGGSEGDRTPSPETAPLPAGVEDDGAFVVMYAGNLCELKGLPLLLEAFALLRATDVRLWVSGRGTLQLGVEDAARRDPRITYLGYLTRQELRERYWRANVLVNPHSTQHASARYLFPSKLLDYLAAGRPVITTRGEGVEAEYGRFVFLLRDEAPDALARLIEEVRARSRAELEEIGARGRDFVLKEKNWARQGRRLADFVDMVASAAERSPKTARL